MALDSRRYVPRPDLRDSGDLPEDLRGVSFELAKFLRYEASRRQLCDNDGWVAVDALIAELGKGGGGRSPLQITDDELYTVVKCSYSKDRARFELNEFNSKTYVRAANRDKYTSRSRWNEPGNSKPGGFAGETSNGYRSGGRGQSGGWDRGNGERRQNGSSWNGISKEFDGTWMNRGAPICRINGLNLDWHDGPKQRIQLWEKDKQIVLPPHQENPRCVGNLNSAGQIIWEDGDIWTRQGTDVKQNEQTPSKTSSTTASTGSSPGCSGSSGDPVNVSKAAADDDEVVNVSTWKEMRVLADWDANDCGEGYLTLKKGELLNVKASGDTPDTDEGWAFGESIQRHAEGWFPPTYVQV